MTRRRTSRRLFQASPAKGERQQESEEEVLPERTISSLPDALLLEVKSSAGPPCTVLHRVVACNGSSLRQHNESSQHPYCVLTSPSSRQGSYRGRQQRPAAARRQPRGACASHLLLLLLLPSQVFRQLARLPPVTDAEEEALYSRRLPFRTFESPGEVRFAGGASVPPFASHPLPPACERYLLALGCPRQGANAQSPCPPAGAPRAAGVPVPGSGVPPLEARAGKPGGATGALGRALHRLWVSLPGTAGKPAAPGADTAVWLHGDA